MAYRAPTSTSSTSSTSSRTTAPEAITVASTREQRSKSLAPPLLKTLRTSSSALHVPEQNVRARLHLIYRYWGEIKEAIHGAGRVVPRGAVAEQLRRLEGAILAEPGFTSTVEQVAGLEQALAKQNAFQGEAGQTLQSNLKYLQTHLPGLHFVLPENAVEFARGEAPARASRARGKPGTQAPEHPLMLATSWKSVVQSLEKEPAFLTPGMRALMRDVELQIDCEKPDVRTLTSLCDRMLGQLPYGERSRDARAELDVFAEVLQRLPHRIPTPMRFQITSRSSTQANKPRTVSSPGRFDRAGLQAALQRRENLKGPIPPFNLELEKDEDGAL